MEEKKNKNKNLELLLTQNELEDNLDSEEYHKLLHEYDSNINDYNKLKDDYNKLVDKYNILKEEKNKMHTDNKSLRREQRVEKNNNGTFLIENRDFYIAAYHKCGDDFSEIFCTSYEDPKYGPVKKVTRAECIYAGWEFKKQDDGVLCTYYTLGDMKLNQTLVNTTLGEVAKQVVYLKQILEK